MLPYLANTTAFSFLTDFRTPDQLLQPYLTWLSVGRERCKNFNLSALSCFAGDKWVDAEKSVYAEKPLVKTTLGRSYNLSITIHFVDRYGGLYLIIFPHLTGIIITLLRRLVKTKIENHR